MSVPLSSGLLGEEEGFLVGSITNACMVGGSVVVIVGGGGLVI